MPFATACGECFFCNEQLWSLCDRSNPNADIAAMLYGYSPAGLFGYSHLLGGYAGGQAEYLRVPYAEALLGAGRVIAIDRVRERLAMAERERGAEVIDYERDTDVVEVLKEETGGRGPDACIDGVGSEAHGAGP